jgi:hypothetical protein
VVIIIGTSYRGFLLLPIRITVILYKMSFKFTDIIPQYDGSGDFSEWVRKLELVAKLQKVSELEDFLPLFLYGGAFSVYQNLNEKIKNEYKLLKAALISCFSLNQFQAYNQLFSRKLEYGESVDVYVADLKRLSDLVSPNVDNDEWVKCAVISGLPQDIKQQLTGACTLEQLKLQDVVDRARTLVKANDGAVSAVSLSGNENWRGKRQQQPAGCYTCGKEGHTAKYCSQQSGYQFKKGKEGVQCYNCGNFGHFANFCNSRRTKND